MVTSTGVACIVFTTYISISYWIFNKVYGTVYRVIDEEFHISQGLAYCNFNFTAWHPKITTLPGLYILSTILLGPLGLCTTYWLRFLNFLAGIVNIYSFAVLFGGFDKNVNEGQKIRAFFSSFNLAILPPLYFFTNLYYTDVVSVMFITLLLLFNRRDQHVAASIFGLLCVLIRQTNIIWVGMLFGDYVLRQFHSYCVKGRYQGINPPKINEKDIRMVKVHRSKTILNLRIVPKQIWVNNCAYLTVILLFVMFLLINGSIVVGDKTAHAATVHIPQIFYFSLFCLAFAWPHFLHLIVPFIKYVSKRKLLVATLVTVMIIIVYTNTLVHPYLLADNRHYTFYIWNRLYEKYWLFRYLVIPVYLFGLYSIFSSIYSRNDMSFSLMYIPCTIFVLILQKMIEIRYFLIPFIILRSKIYLSYRTLFLELLTYVVINVVTFAIFFTKNIYWEDFDYVQKLIW